MSVQEAVTLIAAVTASIVSIISAVAGLYAAQKAHDTHELVNGQSGAIQALREEKGRSEGLIAGYRRGRAINTPGGTQDDPPP